MKKFLILFILAVLYCSCCTSSPLPGNFHKVNPFLYRSGQPDTAQIEYISAHNGIKSILNLREYHSDKDEMEKVNLKNNNSIKLYEIPLAAGSINEQDLYKILTTIRDAPKPLLIHCRHGSDRTGCAVAASRIVFENWKVEDAVAELMLPKYGHHKFFYPNISALLRQTNWQKLKKTILTGENKKKQKQ